MKTKNQLHTEEEIKAGDDLSFWLVVIGWAVLILAVIVQLCQGT